TSMGAIIGALYSSGLKAKQIEEIALKLDWKRLMFLADITLPYNGLIKGRRATSLLKSFIGDLTFAQLKYDFSCVATDIINGEQVVLNNGSLINALRASFSIPGIFTPVKINGRYLVDGGLVNEVPVSVCREMGADYVIGVNVIPEPCKSTCELNKDRRYFSEITQHIKKVSITSKPQSGSFRSRLNNMEKSVESHLLFHQHKEKDQITGSHDIDGLDIVKKAFFKSPNLIDILTQSITITAYHVAIENLKTADLAISPDVKDIGFWRFDKAAEAILAGEKAAREALATSS
ncbi:MAG: patatin-like phospholipase family protein, partial [Chloroflexi bacterium]|nr:patatin-like phospholipase family protein [Chloroflexota bacterium]